MGSDCVNILGARFCVGVKWVAILHHSRYQGLILAQRMDILGLFVIVLSPLHADAGMHDSVSHIHVFCVSCNNKRPSN